MSKMEALARLFDEWKEEFAIPATNFYSDGIINESLFDSCPTGKKILVIAKEPNARNHDQQGDRSFVTEWDNQKADYPFACRIAEWVHGIIHNFPAYDSIKENALPFLRHISFMNVKKTGGSGRADHTSIHKIAELHKTKIVEEIEIINPDIIILGLSFDAKLITQIFGKLKWIQSGYDIKIAEFWNAKVISFYHPSARNGHAAAYSLLQHVVQSEAFTGL